jgi:pilus assembly protein CpaF
LAGENISHKFIVPTVAATIDLIVHVGLSADGTRRIHEIVSVTGRVENDRAEIEPLWRWDREAYTRGLGSIGCEEKFATAGFPIETWWHK